MTVIKLGHLDSNTPPPSIEATNMINDIYLTITK